MAIKLFPGSGERTVNVLLMDDIAGSTRQHVVDATLTNHPVLGGLPSLGVIPTALRIRSDLNAADAALSPAGPDLRYRPIGQLTGDGTDTQPYWMRLSVGPAVKRVAKKDFREELRVAHYPRGTLIYDIDIAGFVAGGREQADWRRVGVLKLEHDVTSAACDGNLHFAHPRLGHVSK